MVRAHGRAGIIVLAVVGVALAVLALAVSMRGGDATSVRSRAGEVVRAELPVRLVDFIDHAEWRIAPAAIPAEHVAVLQDAGLQITGEALDDCAPFMADWGASERAWLCRTRYPLDANTRTMVRKGVRQAARLVVFRDGVALPENSDDGGQHWYGVRQGVVVIEAIDAPPDADRFRVDYPVDPAWLEEFNVGAAPAAAAVAGSIAIQGDLRPALLAPSPAEYRFRVALPRQARIAFSYGVLEEAWRLTNGVRFTVTIDAGEGAAEVFADTIDPQRDPERGRWREVALDPGVSAEVVELTFRTEPVAGDHGAYAVGAFANPRIEAVERGGTPVVIIDLDTLRADHLPTYGYARDTAPNLAALAEESVVFDNAIVPSSWTLPSQMSILTGRLPAGHGVRTLEDRLPDDVDTLAAWLRRDGYRTIGITDGGFVSAHFGFDRGFDSYCEWTGYAEFGLVEGVYERLRRWLTTSPDARSFYFLHTYQPHHPYAPPEADWRRWDPDYDGDIFERFGGDVTRLPEVTPEELHHIVARYDGEIRYTDRIVGRKLDLLRAHGLYDDAIIVVLSDHGEEFQEHGGWFHGMTLYEEQLHVPLWIKFPKGTIAPLRYEAVVEISDVAPTIAEFLGIDVPDDLDGRSLLSRIEAQRERGEVEADASAFAELRDMWALRMREHKLIVGPGARLRLFSLADDPREQVDVSEDEPKLTRFLLELGEARASRGARDATAAGELDEATRQRLRMLGYLP